MRSDAAFETANKAAAPLTAAGGVVMAVCGVFKKRAPVDIPASRPTS
jgi:hypothetical protein